MSVQIDLLNNDSRELCDGIFIGATWEAEFEWEGVDISGMKFRAGITDPDTGDSIQQLISAVPINDTDEQIRSLGPIGQFKLILVSTLTTGYTPKKHCKYDIFYSPQASNDWQPLFYGLVDISKPKTDLS